jgi:hypothetical protein
MARVKRRERTRAWCVALPRGWCHAARFGLKRKATAAVTVQLKAVACTLCLPQASFVGAVAIADLVKSTLGPKGMVRLVASAASLVLQTCCAGG